MGSNLPSFIVTIHKYPFEKFLNCVKSSIFLEDFDFFKGSCINNYIPFFLAGRRTCLGENLARMELFIFFTQFMHQFRFESTWDGESVSQADQGRNPKDYQVRAIARD